jgi:hypothetical protein
MFENFKKRFEAFIKLNAFEIRQKPEFSVVGLTYSFSERQQTENQNNKSHTLFMYLLFHVFMFHLIYFTVKSHFIIHDQKSGVSHFTADLKL